MKIEVKGHSGCNVEICQVKDSLLINKFTQNPKYAPRLYNQARKQMNARQLGNIYIPKIVKLESNKNSTNILMEYVYSKNFIKFFETTGADQLNKTIQSIINYIHNEINFSQTEIINPSIIKNKFDDVLKNINNNECIKNDTEIQDLYNASIDIVCNDKEVKIPVGVCHGDLTFSNILFSGSNIYLIDFLDSFIESPLMDIVKIRQDSQFGWSQRMYEDSYDKIRLNITLSYIDEIIDKEFSQYDWYKNNYKGFQLMNFWRVMQYAHDEEVIKYLKNVINNIIYG